jgi:CRP-like cAMP-binding protein
MQEGEPGTSFYILVRGTVEVTRLEGGQPRRIAKLQDGDCFGEMALLSNKPRNATIRTLTPCVCLSLKRDLFDRLLEREPELQAHIRTLSALRAGSDAV